MDRFVRDNFDALAARVSAFGTGLVAFDGRPGAGKTTVARLVSERLGCGRADGDAYLVRDQGVFLEALRLPDLRAAIEDQLEAHGLALLSTVCAGAVLERVEIKPVGVVWIERTSPIQIGNDERDFDEDHNADLPEAGAVYALVESYVRQYKARERCSFVYLNAYEE